MVDEHPHDVPLLKVLFQTLYLLSEIYHDLNCHDIPEFFVTHLKEFMGLLLKYMRYENPLLVGEVGTILEDDGSGSDEEIEDDANTESLYNSHCRMRMHLVLFSSSKLRFARSWNFTASATRRISHHYQTLSRHHGHY
jgi:hypothetical protein